MHSSGQVVSILDIDLSESMTMPYQRILNSPRTLEAMANLGIRARELDDISYETVKQQIMDRERKQNVPSLIVDLRYDNLQKKR